MNYQNNIGQYLNVTMLQYNLVLVRLTIIAITFLVFVWCNINSFYKNLKECKHKVFI